MEGIISHSFGAETTTATTDADTDSVTTDTETEFFTGIVKFYKREEFYGFIKPDRKGGDKSLSYSDIYFHRRDVVSDLPYEKFPENPCLFRNDRVRYRMVPVADKEGRHRATDITKQNGEPFPPLNETFLRSRMRYAHNMLGRHVHSILQRSSELSNEQQLEEMQEAWQHFLLRQKAYHDIIRSVGMNVDDFQVDDVEDRGPDLDAKLGTTTHLEEEQGEEQEKEEKP